MKLDCLLRETEGEYLVQNIVGKLHRGRKGCGFLPPEGMLVSGQHLGCFNSLHKLTQFRNDVMMIAGVRPSDLQASTFKLQVSEPIVRVMRAQALMNGV
jgi:hypothetical protein